MNVSDWLFLPLITVFMVSVGLLLVLGAVVMRPQDWDHKVYDAGVREAVRRIEALGPRSQAELDAAGRMVGTEPTDSAGEADDMILDAVVLLTDSPDRAATDAELRALRERLEGPALERQLRLVARVPSLRVASILWRGSRVLNTMLFAIVGFRWFFPRALPVLGRRLQKHGGVLTVIGLVVGVGWAWFARALAPDETPFDWWSVVGNVSLAAALVGIVVALGGMYKALLVARFGEAARWTPRGILLGVFTVAMILGAQILNLSGVLPEWQRQLAESAAAIDMSAGGWRWVGAVVVVAIFGYMIRNLVRRVRDKNMYLSERLWLLTFAPVVAVIIPITVVYALDVPFAGLSMVLLVMGYTMLALASVASVASSIEWIIKYRALKQAGWEVPKKGFRWWVLITWIAAGVILTGGWSAVMNAGTALGYTTGYFVLNSVWNLLTALWSLALYPGLVITFLYVRRVARNYDNLRFLLASPHPDLA